MFFTRLRMILIDRRGYVILLLLGSLLFLLVCKPLQVPPPLFDEGWTLSVARNWVEKGVYARLLINQPVSYTGMAWSYPVTLPVALSFSLFGVGVLQGRLPNIFLTVISLYLLYRFARKLFGEFIGGLTLGIVLFASTGVHVLIMGRQVMAEMPMLFYLLVGFLAFYFALQRSSWLVFFAMFCWGTALTCKLHPLPFLSFSLVACFLVAWRAKNRRVAWIALAAWVGSLAVYQSLTGLEKWLSSDLPLYGAPMKGLYEIVAFVFDRQIRIDTLVGMLGYGMPTLLGVVYGIYHWAQNGKGQENAWFYTNLTNLLFTASWIAWYVFLSPGWQRYLFPASFLGSPYLALMLDRFTHHFDVKWIANALGGNLRRLKFSWDALKSFLAIFIILQGVVFSVAYLTALFKMSNAAVYEAVSYIHNNTPPDALVETYDSELIFLLHRPVHFPPDQLQVDLNRRSMLDPDTPIDYDPLINNPDVIVVGPYSRIWRLYEPVLKLEIYDKAFASYGYEVYVRSAEISGGNP